jgi:DNA end-binding protein Ku
MATQLVESLTEAFEPEKFEDTYRHQVLDLIDRKASGEEIVAAPAPAAEDKVVDLMAALEASVRDAKSARGRHPTAKAASVDGDSDEDEDSGSSGGARKSRSTKKAAKTSKTSKAAPKRKSA